MYEKKLEFRGIHRKDLIQYLLELGGNKRTEWDITFLGNGGECFISEESYLRWFHSDIPVVFITFKAEKQQFLDHLIKQFRLKTFRAGG